MLGPIEVPSPSDALAAAVDEATAGRLDAAMTLLADVDKTFTRRRLAHLIKNGDPRQRAAADMLWKKLFSQTIRATPTDDTVSVHVVRDVSPQPQPKRIDVEQPEPFLAWVTGYREGDDPLQMDTVELAQVWGLAGLGALCLSGRPARVGVVPGKASDAARFAHAVGFDEIVTEQRTQVQLEEGRTVRLRRVTRHGEIESTADEVSRLIVPAGDAGDVRRSIKYVLIELLRNVIQHSEDRAGGVVAAQLMNRGTYMGRPMIQVAVADAGIGIPEHLGRMHRGVDDPRVALERALWPHISGTFPPGLTGARDSDNAGLGLFFIAEQWRGAGRLALPLPES
jgi:anti-sigma regulatory factor (Ser/Thr protein kinase)